MARIGSTQLNPRKALGALKDSTKVRLAKVNSEYKELDIAIGKATNHVEHIAMEKHMSILFCVRHSALAIYPMCSMRLQRKLIWPTRQMVLRSCSITGPIPSYIGERMLNIKKLAPWATTTTTTTTTTNNTFRSLVESADRKFLRVRDLPLYGRTKTPQHYYHKVFKAYTKLWKFQQENRSKLVESGLQRSEIGEIASRIGQLYYGQYMTSSETRFLLEAYVFYEAILSRGYFEKVKTNGNGKRDLGLRFKELRFYARFLIVGLLLNRLEMVHVLVQRFRLLVDDSKATFRDTNFREWKQVVQEIVRFLKVDNAFMHTRPLRYCTVLDSHPNSLPYVARFHAKKVLKLRETLLTSYHRNEVRFTELTLDTFRMLQCLEWEPSGSFFQMHTTESSNNGGLDQSGASGLIDINLAMDMTDPTLPPNPKKAILYRPSVPHLISVIATICEDLPPDSIFLIYLAASGKAGRNVAPQMETSGGLRNSSNLKIPLQTYPENNSSSSEVLANEQRYSNDFHGDSLWLGPKGSGGPNHLYPGDIIPFTRRPLFLIIDSDSSHAFKAEVLKEATELYNIVNDIILKKRVVIHGAERGETAALLLSPQRPAFRTTLAADPTNNGSQFTFFLTSPLQAFCQLVGLSPSDTSNKDILDKTETILLSAFSEWEVKLCTTPGLDLVWAQIISDPFLRRLILRFILCRSVLSLFCISEDHGQYLPECLPPLPDYVSPTSEAVQYNILRLATSLGVAECFNFGASLHTRDMSE
ncbi:hypothetical protein IFM89_037982 [Coptis chinensis]|uniref:Protein SCAI n=1 Tax=Coptis chinensis TaxID=261450 RepID=A0A835I8S5_9MAGN|nr:hypothetical protein IFM89_037982 [Coptis chinensis]